MIEVPLSIEVILIGAIIAQGIFATALLLMHRDNLKSNRYLALLVLFFTLWLLDDFFNAAKIYQQNPNFYFLPIYYSFGFGPLIYFYTRSITEWNFTFTKKHVVHFIPMIIQGLLYVFLQCSAYSYRRYFWQEIHLPYTYNIEFVGSLISMLIYLLISIKLVWNYQNWISNRFSEISKINLNWLKITLGIITMISFLWMIDSVLRLVWNYYAQHDFSAISMGISILLLATGALLQSRMVDTEFEHNSKNISIEKSRVDIDELLLSKVKAQMSSNKYYLIPTLSLKDFANHLQEPPRKVSEQINKGLGKSFIDFVNEYRIKAFKEHIEQGELTHLTLVGIAMECGFNSKSTFNRVFKKVCGQSPSVYQKEVQNKN